MNFIPTTDDDKMQEPVYDKALNKWCVRYALARWWFDSWEVANDWYLLNKDKF